jgi:Ser/Thr protein kinase RdoA (MazF antagonist)
LRRVLKHYNLGSVQAFRPAETGYVNDNWFVDTSEGRYFLKHRHPSLCCPDIIRPQHQLVSWLRQAGFSSPTLVPTVGGETLLLHEDECYEVQEAIEGGPYDHDRPRHLEEAAATLARYHDLVAGLHLDALCSGGILYSPALLGKNLDRLVHTWRLERENGLRSLVRRLEDHRAELEDRFARHAPLPYLIIHGDYHGDNLLFQGDSVAGLVDYDKACWQPRVAELAEVLIYFASPRHHRLCHLVYPDVLRWQPFTRFLRAYAQVLCPSESEIAALPDYVGCVWLQMATQRLLERGDHRAPQDKQTLQELLILADWARASARKMVEICQAAADAVTQCDPSSG